MTAERVKSLSLTRLPAKGMDGCDDDGLYRGKRRLFGDLKGANRFDLIAKEFNPPRVPLTWGENIDNIASHAKLTHLFDHGDALVAEID